MISSGSVVPNTVSRSSSAGRSPREAFFSNTSSAAITSSRLPSNSPRFIASAASGSISTSNRSPCDSNRAVTASSSEIIILNGTTPVVKKPPATRRNLDHSVRSTPPVSSPPRAARLCPLGSTGLRAEVSMHRIVAVDPRDGSATSAQRWLATGHTARCGFLIDIFLEVGRRIYHTRPYASGHLNPRRAAVLAVRLSLTARRVAAISFDFSSTPSPPGRRCSPRGVFDRDLLVRRWVGQGPLAPVRPPDVDADRGRSPSPKCATGSV